MGAHRRDIQPLFRDQERLSKGGAFEQQSKQQRIIVAKIDCRLKELNEESFLWDLEQVI